MMAEPFKSQITYSSTAVIEKVNQDNLFDILLAGVYSSSPCADRSVPARPSRRVRSESLDADWGHQKAI